MILCQFIFTPGNLDDEFEQLDQAIDAYARSLPGFRGTEIWQSKDARTINASYYFDDRDSIHALSKFPSHHIAKGQYLRWYDGYQVIVSEITASYGDGRLQHLSEDASEH